MSSSWLDVVTPAPFVLVEVAVEEEDAKAGMLVGDDANASLLGRRLLEAGSTGSMNGELSGSTFSAIAVA
jgi:hypothetical protein